MEPGSPGAAPRLLLVDDDRGFCDLVIRFLSGEGFSVDAEHTADAGVGRALSRSYALVMLDVMLGRANGFDVLRRIRAESQIPVLMLTAKGEPLDRVIGLEIGADDYVPKPFNPPELAARIRAILRRAAAAHTVQSRVRIVVDDVEIDPSTRQVRRGGMPVDLTSIEFDLLDALARQAGEIVSRESLVHQLLGREFSPFDHSINTHIYNLRRKLGPRTDRGARIVGIRGVGYLYACSSKSSSHSG